jgi:hypothetical protein
MSMANVASQSWRKHEELMIRHLVLTQLMSLKLWLLSQRIVLHFLQVQSTKGTTLPLPRLSPLHFRHSQNLVALLQEKLCLFLKVELFLFPLQSPYRL